MDVKFEVSAEMVYEGSMMSYTVRDTRIFQVRNSKKNNANQTSKSSTNEQQEESKEQ